MATQFAPSIPTKRLAAPILSTDMVFSLNNYLGWDSVAISTSDFPTSCRGVFRNTTNTQIEFFTFDPSTVGGPITILTRGNDYKGGTAGGVKPSYNWPANSTLVELGSNPPAEAEDYVDKTSNETIAGIKTFSSSPIIPTGGTGTQAANANDIAAAITGASGTANATTAGTVKTSVAPSGTGVAIITIDPLITGPQSGTALNSSSNKIEDAGDTSSTASANKLVRANASGLIDNSFLTNVVKFGGTGSDGALSISSGTTTISCGNAAVIVKNYTSISITGTGKLAFSNPNTNGTTVILKSQGSVTLTSSTAPMIDFSALGGAGGASATSGSASNVDGNPGSTGLTQFIKTNFGLGSATSAGGAIASLALGTFANIIKYSQYLFVGAGGGSGSAEGESGHTATSGVGGIGGGCGIIECAGAWNFTTSNGISVAGQAGGAGNVGGGGTNTDHAGGGGGGGAGFFLGLYNLLTANSGTVTISGGTGGNGVANGATNQTGGGGGGSLANTGNNGTANSGSVKTGGDGGAGISIVTQNTEYA